MINSSGQGDLAELPPEIAKWNWGALLLNWIWALFNSPSKSVLFFIPIYNIYALYRFGKEGNAWAWRYKEWDSVEHFNAVQNQWARWGIAVWTLLLPLGIFVNNLLIPGLESSEVFHLAQVEIERNTTLALRELGKPYTFGNVYGQISDSSTIGSASISFGIRGTRGNGTVLLKAIKTIGQWRVESMELQTGDKNAAINLLNEPKREAAQQSAPPEL